MTTQEQVVVRMGLDATSFREGIRKERAEIASLAVRMKALNREEAEAKRQTLSVEQRLVALTRTQESIQMQMNRAASMGNTTAVKRYELALAENAQAQRRLGILAQERIATETIIQARARATAAQATGGAPVGGFGKMLGSVLSLGLVARASRNAAMGGINFGSDLVDTSESIGSSTGFVQRFNFAALQTGVGLERGRASLEKFTGSLGQAREGVKEQVMLFEKLGVSIDGSVEEVFTRTAAALSKIADSSKRVMEQRKLFGRGGGSMTEMLTNFGALGAQAPGGKAFDVDTQVLDAAGDDLATLGMKGKTLGATLVARIADFLSLGRAAFVARMKLGELKTATEDAGEAASMSAEDWEKYTAALKKTADLQLKITEIDFERSLLGMTDAEAGAKRLARLQEEQIRLAIEASKLGADALARAEKEVQLKQIALEIDRLHMQLNPVVPMTPDEASLAAASEARNLMLNGAYVARTRGQFNTAQALEGRAGILSEIINTAANGETKDAANAMLKLVEFLASGRLVVQPRNGD